MFCAVVYRFEIIRFVFLVWICFPAFQAEAQVKELNPFQRIKAAGDVSVEIIQSEEHKAEYTILKGFERDLVFEMKDDLLTIRVKAPEKSKYNRLVTKAKVKLYCKELREINIGNLSAISNRDTFSANFLKISGSKSGKGSFTLRCFDLSVEASQTCFVSLAGKTQTLRVRALTQATVSAESLWAKEVNVETSGSSKVNVYAESALSGKVSEGAVLTYKGNPTYKNIDSQQGGKVVEPK
ncbi:MAG: DUF2807 domain-containing protein [Saprospiraceae bacterium]|nr:DUF2807 domain-containing protein [Saprospiraceae bacterium]